MVGHPDRDAGHPRPDQQGLAGDRAITIEWEAPTIAATTEITTYDIRYIETTADESDDANWTLMSGAGSSGSLRLLLSGLTNETSYDVQVRALGTTEGAWSATSTATPLEHADVRTGSTLLPLNTQMGGFIDDAGHDVDFFTFALTERPAWSSTREATWTRRASYWTGTAT